jgi:BirA family biotin operon repressor/biotin-[acetyl-CoA-carboxylase] ligase
LSNNIYLSLSWEYALPYNKVEGLSLAIGVVILNSLEVFGYSNLKLKWPNDILFDGAKLAGVLVEIFGDVNSSLKVIVGVGINVSMSAEQGSVIDRSWTDLSSIRREPPPSRNELLAGLIDNLLDLLSSYPKNGFSHWRNSWNERDAFLGKQVHITSSGKVLPGISRGVDLDGKLILETPEGLLCIAAGDVSLREYSK